MTGVKLKRNQVAKARSILQAQQGNRCALCQCDFAEMTYKKRKRVPKYVSCLDHCHKTGFVRAVLCKNCNGKEGEIFRRASSCKRLGDEILWLIKLMAYWVKHQVPQTKYIHPDHKSDDDKRILRNTRERKKRANAKAAAIIKAQGTGL